MKEKHWLCTKQSTQWTFCMHMYWILCVREAYRGDVMAPWYREAPNKNTFILSSPSIAIPLSLSLSLAHTHIDAPASWPFVLYTASQWIQSASLMCVCECVQIANKWHRAVWTCALRIPIISHSECTKQLNDSHWFKRVLDATASRNTTTTIWTDCH